MKIGVFGDSFASLKFEQNTTLTWVDFLSEKYDVTNFALPSSNLYYSANKFMETVSSFDKIIFVATVPGRLHFPDWVTVGNRDKFIAGLEVAEWKFNNSTKHLTSIEIKALKAAIDYYTYIDDVKFNNFIQQLMIKKVIDSRPDAIVLPVSKSSYGEPDLMHSTSLLDIFNKENQAWGITATDLLNNYVDLRNCHMTAENNVVLANKVEQWLDGQPVEIILDEFVTPMNKEFYIRKL